MASIYKRPGSAFWWIKFKDASGAVRRKSTKYLHSDAEQTRRAKKLELELSRKESMALSVDAAGAWETWVPKYIKTRYEGSPKTYQRYVIRWNNLIRYLNAKGILFPRQFTVQHSFDYIDWRQSDDGRYGRHSISKNTALGEIKFLGVLMKHAIRCGFADGPNPCIQLGVEKDKPDEKPEIEPEHLRLIWGELQDEPEWMRISFQIALYTGCRQNETNVLLKNADTAQQLIHFHDTKGDRPFTVPMRPELVPLFERLKRERPGKTAFDVPLWRSGKPIQVSLAWWKFFNRIHLGQYCFHCTRVTFITWGARSGVPQSDMMKLVNHASEEIHQVYKRIRPVDVKLSLLRIAIPSLSQPEAPREAGTADGPQSTA